VGPTGLNPRSTGPWPPPLGSFLCKHFNRLQGCILTLREGWFDPRTIVPCSGLYKRGPRPPLQRGIHSINHQPESRRLTNNSHLLRAPSDLGIARLELEVEESSSLGFGSSQEELGKSNSSLLYQYCSSDIHLVH
jgi:hypothetical protein